jgi:hypothetical protein
MHARSFIVSAAEQGTDQSLTASSAPRKPVSYVPWLPTAAAFAGSTLWSFFPGPVGFLFGLAAAIAIVLWLVIVICRFLIGMVRRHWRNTAARFVQITLAVPLVGMGVLSGDYVHLALAYPYYLQQLATRPERPLRFAWGDRALTVLEGTDFRTLIYDSSRTTPIVRGEKDQEGLFTTTQHFVGPFYLEEKHDW